ncbi:MAG TPA: hypothetical protein VHY57_08005 [Rhizomicrobium sp.]|nr:hypothetical protein [Rhizomicrobium sp.]
MALRLRVDTKRLFPFVLFRSLAQLAFWLAIVVSGAAIASLFIHHQGELQSAIVGGIIGSLFAWIPRLPYELRLEPVDMRECLLKVCAYLIRSNMTHIEGRDRSQIGLGEWIPNPPRFQWKGNEVEVSIDGQAVIVRGPRSMIKPLWRNFRGLWRKVLTPA